MNKCKEFSAHLTEKEKMFLIFAFFFLIWDELNKEEREGFFNV